MTLRIRHLAALALALGASIPAAAQEDARGVLFAVVQAEDREGVLEPVAMLVRDGFLHPVSGPADSAEQAFNARWLAAGRSYPVLSRGERVGSIAVRTADAPACEGLTARGTFSVRPAPAIGWQALAGEGIPEQADAPWLRATTSGEKRPLDGMAAALFQAHGTDVAALTRGDTAVAALTVHPNARPVLVASYSLATDGALLRRASLLVIAEEGQDGYRPAYAWFHEGMDDGVETRTLVDAADLDGDGMPELVVRTLYYESWDFLILRRTPAGWMEAYRGGGGGC
ncbi:MAG TPA: hypothetical protein VE871_00610 [Longimicrobium sp.]|nr:hypothetical protein [Longimicrobium sp.]